MGILVKGSAASGSKGGVGGMTGNWGFQPPSGFTAARLYYFNGSSWTYLDHYNQAMSLNMSTVDTRYPMFDILWNAYNSTSGKYVNDYAAYCYGCGPLSPFSSISSNYFYTLCGAIDLPHCRNPSSDYFTVTLTGTNTSSYSAYSLRRSYDMPFDYYATSTFSSTSVKDTVSPDTNAILYFKPIGTSSEGRFSKVTTTNSQWSVFYPDISTVTRICIVYKLPQYL